MSATPADNKLTPVLADVLSKLQRPAPTELAATWAALAADLWICTPGTLRAALDEHTTTPKQGDAWSLFVALLGREEMGSVPCGAWPAVEAELVKGLRQPETARPDSPATGLPQAKKRSITAALKSQLDQPPWRTFKRIELAADNKGYRKFNNDEQGYVYRFMGHALGSQQTYARQVETDLRWKFAYTLPGNALKQIEKQGGLAIKVQQFFEKPKGALGSSWMKPDISSATSKEAAESLIVKVGDERKGADQELAKLPAFEEKAAISRRIKTFKLKLKDEDDPNSLPYEKQPEAYGYLATHVGENLTGVDVHLQGLVDMARIKWGGVEQKLSALEFRLQEFLESEPAELAPLSTNTNCLTGSNGAPPPLARWRAHSWRALTNTPLSLLYIPCV